MKHNVIIESERVAQKRYSKEDRSRCVVFSIVSINQGPLGGHMHYNIKQHDYNKYKYCTVK